MLELLLGTILLWIYTHLLQLKHRISTGLISMFLMSRVWKVLWLRLQRQICDVGHYKKIHDLIIFPILRLIAHSALSLQTHISLVSDLAVTLSLASAHSAYWRRSSRDKSGPSS